MKKFLKFARCPALKRLAVRLVELSARVASSILKCRFQLTHKLKISENTKVEKEAKALTTTEHQNELNDTSAGRKGAKCSEWNRKLYTAPVDSRKKWSMRLWYGRSKYVIIFLYFLSCDKQVHVNFWSTYFQQDTNRWQTFSLRWVRERPERPRSLPPPKTTSSANQASGLLSSVLERDNIEQVRMLHQLHQGIWPLKDTMFLSVFDRQTRVTGNGHMSGAWDN